MNQHKVISFPEVPPKFPTPYYDVHSDSVEAPVKIFVESSLSRNLRRFRRFGVRVLDFWRENGRWQVKVMRAA